MQFAPGTRFGPYELLTFIGAGGMGEVYKARDTRLDRPVAIKVLPRTVSADPDRRARFEREARTIGALSHSHICTLHDVGERASATTGEGTLYLVMEHLTGDTLAERLRKGPLPLDQALTVATEIADALAAAHRQGVVHRDLKPGNVMLTKSGVKLLDFGLAKLTARDEQPVAAHPMSAPTYSAPLTGQGTILGTLQYMAPEQLEAQPTDARADLWAFGAIVHEMVTGQPAFGGTSAASVIASILGRDPAPLSTLQPLTPPALDLLVRQCLSKSPDDRPDTAHDVANHVRWIRQSGSAAAVTGVQPRRARWKRIVGTCVSVLSGVLVGGATLWLFRPVQAAPTPIRATIPLKSAPIENVGEYAHIAISPDGQTLVFKEDGLLVRRGLNSFSTVPLEGTRGAQFPAFSPDGSALAFHANGHIKRVSLSGGPVADVARASVSDGLAWGEDDRMYFSAGFGDEGIWRVSAAGMPEAVTHVDDKAGENAHVWPQLLPGGKALLFTAEGPSVGSDDSRVVVQVIGSRERTTVADKAIFGRYVQSGHLIFARNDGTVYAVPFDPVRLKATGAPVPVLSGVGTGTAGGAAFFAASATGTLAFLGPTQRPDSQFRMVGAKGEAAATSFAFDAATMAKVGTIAANLRVAPDGRRYALTGRSPGVADVWTVDANSGETERVTLDRAEDEYPVWSRDGHAIAYTSAQTGTARRIFIRSIESGTAPTLVRTWPRHVHLTSWSPDGRWLAAYDYTATNGTDVWAVAADGGKAIAVANGPGEETGATFSPDGKWIAYASNESGRPEVYVVSFPGLGSRRQVSTDGGAQPAWDSQGRILYYLQNGYLVAHEVSLSHTFTKGRATRLFATQAVAFEVAPGGRFVLSEPNAQPSDDPLRLIVNWFTELRAKVPVR